MDVVTDDMGLVGLEYKTDSYREKEKRNEGISKGDGHLTSSGPAVSGHT